MYNQFLRFADEDLENVPIIDGKIGPKIIIDGVECWNFASHNYLGFAGREDIEEEAIQCIRKFGVGSCGPRAFLGKKISPCYSIK